MKISATSSLVVSGSGVTIESLDLDGALVIECEEGATGAIRNLVVKNKGWTKVADESSADETIKMRGYHLKKEETRTIVFKKDGSIEGDYDPSTAAEAPEAPKEKVIERGTEDTCKGPALDKPTAEESAEDNGTCGSCIIL